MPQCEGHIEADEQWAGQETTCPHCGTLLKIPAFRTVSPKSTISVTGNHHLAVSLVRIMLEHLQRLPVQSNPFTDASNQFAIEIVRISAGSSVVRWMLLSLVGRPRIDVRFRLHVSGQAIVDETLSSSIFFENRKDQTFRGGALGGADASFLKGNCRKICEAIVEKSSRAISLDNKTKKRLIKETRKFVFPKN